MAILLNIPAAYAATLFSEKIEVKVGSDIILTTDLDLMKKALKVSRPDVDQETLHQTALDALIDQALIEQFLQKIGYPITERDLDQRIETIRTSQGIQTQQEFHRVLEQQGLTIDQFRSQLRRQVEQMQFMAVIRRQVLHTFEETELKTFYRNNLNKFSKNIEIELGECLIRSSDKDAKAKEAKALYYEKNPKKFSSCVTKLSSAPSKEKKGFIGIFKKGMLREDVEALVFKLDEGETTIVRVSVGYQVLKVLKKRDLGVQKFDDVRDQIISSLESELLMKELEKTLSELKATTFIKIES